MTKSVLQLPQNLGPLSSYADCLATYSERFRGSAMARQKIAAMDAIGELHEIRVNWANKGQGSIATFYDVIAAVAWREGVHVRPTPGRPYISLWSTFFVLTLGVSRATATKWAHGYEKLLRTDTPAQQFDKAVADAGGLDRYAYSREIGAGLPGFLEFHERNQSAG